MKAFWLMCGLILALSTLVTAVIVWTDSSESTRGCRAKGGVEVRSLRGFVCIKAEIID